MSKREITSFFSPKPKRARGANKNIIEREEEEEKQQQQQNERIINSEENEEESKISANEITSNNNNNNQTNNETTNTANTNTTEVSENENNEITSTTTTPTTTSLKKATLTTSCPFDIGTWESVLHEEFSKTYFRNLIRFVDQEYSSATVYPIREQIFSAFTTCDFNKLKVVIIGQDPYHGPNQAHGLSFSVLEGNAPPPSLRNIFKEAQVNANNNLIINLINLI